MIEINGEKSINVEGQDYFFIDQFARLTGRQVPHLRLLGSVGNSLRKLKTIQFGSRVLVLASELFDFPFVLCGHPTRGQARYVERFYMEKGELLKKETVETK